MKTVAGFDRPAPYAWLQGEDRVCKLGAEHARHRPLVRVAEIGVKQQPIAHPCRKIGVARRPELDERLLRIQTGVVALLGIEVDLGEGQSRVGLEASGIRGLESPKLF